MNRLFRAARRITDHARCELCAAAIGEPHEHLYEPRVREVRCVCQGCALIIPSAQGSPFLRVPRRFEKLELAAAPWLERFGSPVGVAALIRRATGAVLAYPGPVGLVEASVEIDLAELPHTEREVEAIVFSTLGGGGTWIVGIDVVFEMISAVRESWVGMSGGPEAPLAIARLLGTLEHRA